MLGAGHYPGTQPLLYASRIKALHLQSQLCSLITALTSPGLPFPEFYAAVKQESNLSDDIVKGKELMTFDCIFHYNRTFEIIISHMIGMLIIEVVTMMMN